MGQGYKRHDGDPAAWTSDALPGGKDALCFDLGARHIAALKDDLRRVEARGLAVEAIAQADFPLASVAPEIARLKDEMVRGRGLVIIRGFPFDDFTIEEVAKVYWGVGTHFGMAVSQSVMGDRLGHVVDMTDVDPHARAYRAKRELLLHTDLSDAVSFCSVHRAMTGGISQFASALAVHDEILRTKPEYMPILYRGFRWHRLGEQGANEEPITPYRVPHFSNCEGYVSCRYVRNYIREAAYHLDQPLTEEEFSALDYFDAIAARPDFKVELLLERGEIVFMNNLTVLHARTAFENAPPPAPKRHLMRLWLAVPGGRPTVPEIQVYGTGPGGGVPKQEEGRMPSFARKASPN